jgi:hypothetical protein
MSFTFSEGRNIWEAIRNSIHDLINRSYGGGGFVIIGGITSETITVAGASGTLGIDIDSGLAVVTSYDEAFDTNVETTIDNWLVTNAALMLAAHGITATKGSASTIVLTGSVRAAGWIFADGGATMTATSGGQTVDVTNASATGSFSCIEALEAVILNSVETTTQLGDLFPFDQAVALNTRLYGNFTKVTIKSGVLIAYRS